MQKAELDVQGITHINWDPHDPDNEDEKLSVSNYLLRDISQDLLLESLE